MEPKNNQNFPFIKLTLKPFKGNFINHPMAIKKINKKQVSNQSSSPGQELVRTLVLAWQ
jgi:hypothetical protein